MILRCIFIILFLVSFGSVSMGDVGDVYYCEAIKYGQMADNGNWMNFDDTEKLKFKFKLEEKRLKMGKDFPFYSGGDFVINFFENRFRNNKPEQLTKTWIEGNFNGLGFYEYHKGKIRHRMGAFYFEQDQGSSAQLITSVVNSSRVVITISNCEEF